MANKAGTSKKEKLILLGLNVLVIVGSSVLSAVSTGQLVMPAWAVSALISVGTLTRLTIKGWNTSK